MIQRNIFFCLIAISGVFVLADAAYTQQSMGARSIAMGQTGVSFPESRWAIFSNIALLPTDERQVSFYGFRYAGISELTDAAAAASLPLMGGTAGAGVHRYGFHLFSETRLRAGYSYRWKNVSAGLAFNYSHVQQGGGCGSAGALGVDIGLSGTVSEALWFGARATNVNQPAYAGTAEELPRELAAGLSYKPAAGVMISAETVKDVRFPISLRFGVDAALIDELNIRGGFTTNPETYAGGFGYRTDRWQINIALQQHVLLGLSPAVDLGVSL